MLIIADPRIDRNFRYAGKKGLPGKAVREFPDERTDTEQQFLQEVERRHRPGFPLSPYQGLLWGERPEEHRPGGVLQTVPGGLSGEHHQRPQADRPLFHASGYSLLHRLRYRRGTTLAQYDKPYAPVVPRIGLRGSLHKGAGHVRGKGDGERAYPGHRFGPREGQCEYGHFGAQGSRRRLGRTPSKGTCP